MLITWFFFPNLHSTAEFTDQLFLGTPHCELLKGMALARGVYHSDGLWLPIDVRKHLATLGMIEATDQYLLVVHLWYFPAMVIAGWHFQ